MRLSAENSSNPIHRRYYTAGIQRTTRFIPYDARASASDVGAEKGQTGVITQQSSAVAGAESHPLAGEDSNLWTIRDGRRGVLDSGSLEGSPHEDTGQMEDLVAVPDLVEPVEAVIVMTGMR